MAARTYAGGYTLRWWLLMSLLPVALVVMFVAGDGDMFVGGDRVLEATGDALDAVADWLDRFAS